MYQKAAAIGIHVHLQRILRPSSRRAVIIPFDHAASDGILPGLTDTRQIIRDAVDAGVDAVMMRPGLTHCMLEADRDTSSLGLILMLTGRLSRGVDHVLFSSVEHAARCGADAVCAEFKLGGEGDLANLSVVARVAETAKEYGLPVMMTTYALAAQVDIMGEMAYAQACRICEELGADLIKTSLPAKPSVLAACLAAVNTPIVLAGGIASKENDLLSNIDKAIKQGIAGVAIGRQAWGSSNPAAMMKNLVETVHRVTC